MNVFFSPKNSMFHLMVERWNHLCYFMCVSLSSSTDIVCKRKMVANHAPVGFLLGG